MAWFDRQKMRDVEIALILRQLTQRLGDVDPPITARSHSQVIDRTVGSVGNCTIGFFPSRWFSDLVGGATGEQFVSLDQSMQEEAIEIAATQTKSACAD